VAWNLLVITFRKFAFLVYSRGKLHHKLCHIIERRRIPMKPLYLIMAVMALLLGLMSSVALATPISGTEITVTASSSYTGRGPENTINGSGLSGTFPDEIHGKDVTTMWMTVQNDLPDAWIQFDLRNVYNLGSLKIWNYGQAGQESRGIKVVDIWVSTLSAPGDPEGGYAGEWTLLMADRQFFKGDSVNPDDGFLLDFEEILKATVQARYVRFEIDSNFSTNQSQKYVGLSEIQFNAVDAVNAVPEPATMLLLGSGLIGVGAFVRRKFKK
jgi:hypothetical protein